MDKTLPVIKAILKLTWIALKMSCYVLNIILTVADESSSKSKRGSFYKGEAYGLFYEGRISMSEFIERTKD